MSIAPIRPITLAEIEAARVRIAPTVLRTPLVKLDLGRNGPDVRLKLENLQPTNSYKIRGAANAIAMLTDDEKARGVWTISAGNASQGLAYAARAAGVRCEILAVETAPKTKLDRMRALGAELVLAPFEVCWRAMEQHTFPEMAGVLIHPFDNHNFIAGHGSMGLEILEDVPDVACVVTPVGGGGLVTGVGSAIKAKAPHIRVLGAEPETGAPLSLSLKADAPQPFPNWQPTFVDGAGGRSVMPRMWERMKLVVDGDIVVTLEETQKAMQLLAEKARVVAEGAGCLPLAAALTGKCGDGPVVCVISGGNVDLKKFCGLIGG